MDADFWHERWAKNETGFHQQEVHPYLQQFWPTLGVAPGSRVFVPLCGKSRDLLWLREQGYAVIGVELSPLAAENFFTENALSASVAQRDGFSIHASEGAHPELAIYCGDFFRLTAAHLAGVNAVFDRAALVALPPAMRRNYAAHMQRILAPETSTLLVSFEYPQEEMQGPPFSVEEAEVRALFAPAAEVQLMDETDILEREPRFRERGLTRLREKAFHLRYRQRG